MGRVPFERRRLAAVVLGAAVGLVLAEPAFARKSKLPPGGRTIGGPGVARLAQGETVRVLTSPTDLAMCITGLGAGKGDARLWLEDPSNNSSLVRKGQIRTLCLTRKFAEIECLGPGSCVVEWRIDAQ